MLRLADGLRDEAALVGASVVGGDLSSGPAAGRGDRARDGSRDGLPCCAAGRGGGTRWSLSGRLGWAEAGLAVLSRGFRSPRVLVEAYRRPEVPYAAALEASESGRCAAMCDVSDGLLADLGHIAESSGVGIDVESALLEVGEPIASVAAAYGTDPMPWVLAGGHDHALVGTVPAELDAAGRLHPDRDGRSEGARTAS